MRLIGIIVVVNWTKSFSLEVIRIFCYTLRGVLSRPLYMVLEISKRMDKSTPFVFVYPLAWQGVPHWHTSERSGGVCQRIFHVSSLSCTSTSVSVQSCRATPAGVIMSDLRKIISFSYELGWRWFYMKIIALSDIYNFVVLSFFHLKPLRWLNN